MDVRKLQDELIHRINHYLYLSDEALNVANSALDRDEIELASVASKLASKYISQAQALRDVLKMF